MTNAQTAPAPSPVENLDAIIGENVHRLMWNAQESQVAVSAKWGMTQSALSLRRRIASPTMTETNSNDAQSMTIDEVADLHRVSRRTVERWISRGDLGARKLPGGLVRIARTDAVAILAPVIAVPDPVDDGGSSLPPSADKRSA